MKPILKSIALLTRQERSRAKFLLVLIIGVAFLDALSVASIMPFIAVTTNPSVIETNEILRFLFKLIGEPEKNDFVLILGGFTLLILISSLVLKAFTTYYQSRFNFMREYSIGRRLIENYLHQPYSWFLQRNSSELGKNILSEVSVFLEKAVIPITTLISQGAVAGALLVLLVIINPIFAITIAIILSIVFIIVFGLMNSALKKWGQNCFDANTKRFSSVLETFTAIKEIKLGRLESVFINRFTNSAELYAKNQSAISAIVLIPRYAIEATAFSTLVIMIVYLIFSGVGVTEALPLISLYVFAGYRLIPAFQQIYGAVSQINAITSIIDVLHNDLIVKKNDVSIPKIDSLVSFDHSIKLSGIYYTYPNTDRHALAGVNLEIPARKVIGIVGTTGCGKTTTVDLILGLLRPERGALYVDEHIIDHSNIRGWQKLIGYVPQQIYLADDTVASNIAFGVQANYIDREQIIQVAKIANLHDFVVNKMPDGYDTKVGERGVRLSGGQRQRIGIARALYHNPQLLILDEATSALDNLTEFAVMEAINKLKNNITIILIAHRLTTVKECDQIYVMEKGKIVDRGNYYQLKKHSPLFQEMSKDTD